MEKGKTFVVGDVHGCLEMLLRLLDVVPWQARRDRLIFVGDCIDRGPDSKGVVDRILELMQMDPDVTCLLGNHEAMLLDYLSGIAPDLYLANQGGTTLREYRLSRRPGGGPSIPQEHLNFYRSLKPYLEIEGYYVVHAGFRPGVEIERQSLEDMVWIREPFLSARHDFGKKVIFGHTPFSQPLVMENKIGIDTGAVYGNRLTCIELPEERFYSVAAGPRRSG